MFLPPRPRYRLYGGVQNFAAVAKDLVLQRITQVDDDLETVQQRVCELVGARHAIFMPQARVGIYLALRALGCEGKKVVLSPYTIHDVINMVICAGAQPVFADIERETCNIDPARIEALVDDQTGAVLITHLHGLACDVERITALCAAKKVPLVEDSAQAFGTRVNGRWMGTFGAAGIYSFGMAKNINSFYGGMVVTDDDGIHRWILDEMRSWPYQSPAELLNRVFFCLTGEILTAPPVFGSSTYWIFRFGQLHEIDAITKRWRGEDHPEIKREIPESYLCRMTPMQARLIDQQIDDIDRHTSTRIDHARVYHRGLDGISQIILPPLREDGTHIYLTFPVQVPDRNDLLNFLTRHGRDLAIQHMANNADAECFREYFRDCPNSRATSDQVLLLPTYPGYGLAEAGKNVALIRRYFGART